MRKSGFWGDFIKCRSWIRGVFDDHPSFLTVLRHADRCPRQSFSRFVNGRTARARHMKEAAKRKVSVGLIGMAPNQLVGIPQRYVRVSVSTHDLDGKETFFRCRVLNWRKSFGAGINQPGPEPPQPQVG